MTVFRRRVCLPGALGLLLLGSCLSDPLGPRGEVVIVPLGFSLDTVFSGTPGRSLSAPVRLRALDAYGNPVVAAEVHWTTAGAGGHVDPATAWTTIDGSFSAVWTLGVHASEPQRLIAEVRTPRHRTTLTLEAQAVPSEAAVIEFVQDTVVLRLGGSTFPDLVATDPFGNPFVPQDASVSSLDPEIAVVGASGRLMGYRRGVARVVAAAGMASDTGVVQVVQVVESLTVGVDTLAFHSLAQTESLVVELWDDQGQLVRDSQPVARIADTSVATTGPGSALTVRSLANGRTTLYLEAGTARRDVPLMVAQRVKQLEPAADTIRLEALQAVVALDVTTLDALGNTVPSVTLSYRMEDSLIASVSASGDVRALANGNTRLIAYAYPESVTMTVEVAQRPVRLITPSDTLRFDAFGEVASLLATAVDSLGFPLPQGVSDVRIADTTVAERVDSATIRTRGNGSTVVTVTLAGLEAQLPILVSQVASRIEMGGADGIVGAPRDSVMPLTCAVVDRNGYAMPGTPLVDPSASGRWTGQTCENLQLLSSGFDTLRIRHGLLSALRPVVLAVRPEVTPGLGEYLIVDSMPTGAGPWASTLRRNPAGEYEVYFADYVADTVNLGFFRSSLHRMVSQDGLNYVYDGVVLEHDDDICGLNGSGIENVVVVPRVEGSGWRMYYASGSFGCYGWQVFSAISADGRNWTKEQGVRLSNGGPVPPAAPVTPPWPVGEGMVVEQLPSGEWRMLTGGYRHIQPREDKFQIVEWRSTDQLVWAYVGPVFTTDELPAGGQRSVYSPTIREFTPGLWRMIVTADDLNVPGGRSRLWSAVSTDQTRWHLEGELMSAEGNDFLYSTMVDDRLVFIRHEAGKAWRLATATVSMP